jgi:hypothetical protein
MECLRFLIFLRFLSVYIPSRMFVFTYNDSCTVVNNSRVGGVVVSVLGIGSKVSGFKPGRGDGFVMAIKMLTKPSSVWEVKPSA